MDEELKMKKWIRSQNFDDEEEIEKGISDRGRVKDEEKKWIKSQLMKKKR